MIHRETMLKDKLAWRSDSYSSKVMIKDSVTKAVMGRETMLKG